MEGWIMQDNIWSRQGERHRVKEERLANELDKLLEEAFTFVLDDTTHDNLSKVGSER